MLMSVSGIREVLRMNESSSILQDPFFPAFPPCCASFSKCSHRIFYISYGNLIFFSLLMVLNALLLDFFRQKQPFSSCYHLFGCRFHRILLDIWIHCSVFKYIVMEGEQFIKIEEEEGLECVPLHCSQNPMLHFYNDDSDQPQAYDMKEHSITENGETPQHFIHSVPSALEYLSLHFDLRTMPLPDILAFAQLDNGFAHFDEWTELKRALFRQKNYLKREHAKKRNLQPNGLNPYFQPDESINTDLKVHLQTQNKKKRNRLSAQISRDRKKQMLQQLEKNHDQMRKQVQQLRVQNQSLKKQLYLQKQENKGRKNKPTFLTLLVFLGIIYLFGMLRQCSEVLKPKKKTDVILSTQEQDEIYDQTESLIGSADVFNNGIKNGMKALIRSQRSTLMPLSLPAKLGKQIVKLS